MLLHRDTLLGNSKMERGFTEVKIASHHTKSWSSFGYTMFFNEAWVNEHCTLPRRLKAGHFFKSADFSQVPPPKTLLSEL